MSLRTIGVVLSSLIVFASGMWLTRSGKPYSGILVNVHKLISLAGVVLLALATRQQTRGENLGPAQAVPIVVTGLLLVANIVTGGLASIDRPMPQAIVVAHRVTPFLSLIAAAVTAYLLPYPR